MQRRLAAILAADVVDYSRLMGADQAGTLAALRQLRSELFEPVVTRHGGIVVKRLGDGWIVEFASVSDAVDCAIGIQEGLASHKLIRLRIGVHTGEVSFEDEDVFGDGVNVAARLEEQAEPGQVLVSDNAYQSLDGKTATFFTGGESHELKNIVRPVNIWRWELGGEMPATAEPVEGGTGTIGSANPAIAVLPFTNISNDPEQEYFTDGITEDLITSLSYQRLFPVIARNTMFMFKDKAVDVTKTGRELGAGYIVEGSVRKSGNRIRITAQLIEVQNGHHVWAKRYDRQLEDVFDLQDEITDELVRAIAPELISYERQKVRARNPDNLTAWDLFLRAQSAIHRGRREDLAEAVNLARQIIKIAPELALGHCMMAQSMMYNYFHNWGVRTQGSFEELTIAARLATELDDRDATAWYVWALTMGFSGRHDEAVKAANRAVGLNPYSVWCHIASATSRMFGGNPEEALKHLWEAERIGGSDPDMLHVYTNLQWAHFYLGKFSDACEFGRKAELINPEYLQIHIGLAAAFGHLNDLEKARRHMSRVFDFYPDLTAKRFQRNLRWRDPKMIEHTVSGLVKAGLPEF